MTCFGRHIERSVASPIIRTRLPGGSGSTSEALLSKLTRHQVEQVTKSMASLGHNEIEGLWFGLRSVGPDDGDRRWPLPRPSDTQRANDLNDESAGGVTPGGASGPAKSGGGRPDRIFKLAIQKAGTNRRQK